MKNELDCLAEALSSLRPGEPMYYNSGKPGDSIDASKIVYESNCSHITQSELDTKIAELQAAYDSKAYARSRKVEYDALNQFELISDDTKNGTTTHIDAIAAIKAKYPKPE